MSVCLFGRYLLLHLWSDLNFKGTYWFTLRFVNFFVEISRLCGTPRFWQIWNQLTLPQPEGGRLCSSNYNWPPTPRIFKPSYSPVQNLLNVIYLSEPKVLTNIVANGGWPRKPGFKSEKKMFGASPKSYFKENCIIIRQVWDFFHEKCNAMSRWYEFNTKTNICFQKP